MIRTVRAAAVAAAAAFALALGWSAPGLAWQGDVHEQAATSAPPRSLDERIAGIADAETGGREEECLASAVYFEARGESLEGQLAVAEVVMNRAASGLYPTSLCGVVAQRSQFSFVRRGRIPRANRGSDAWRRAVGIARLAQEGGSRMLPENTLWYHARYVSPRWGRRLARVDQIGAHIFYAP